MKKIKTFSISIMMLFIMASFEVPGVKYVSNKTHIKFFSTTPAEDIESNNYKSVSTLDTETGEIVFSVPMQSFEFEKALMQKHFNSKKFLDTKSYPKAKLKGTIINLDKIKFDKDGTYDAQISGDLTIKGVTNSINEKGKIIVKEGVVTANSIFVVRLADYGITFTSGKPSTNIAESVEVTVVAEYQNK